MSGSDPLAQAEELDRFLDILTSRTGLSIDLDFLGAEFPGSTFRSSYEARDGSGFYFDSTGGVFKYHGSCRGTGQRASVQGAISDPKALARIRELDGLRRQRIAARRADHLCLACGNPLGLLDRMARRVIHRDCL